MCILVMYLYTARVKRLDQKKNWYQNDIIDSWCIFEPIAINSRVR